MKSLHRRISFLCLVAGVGLVAAVALAQQKNGGVEISDRGIVIHPGTKIEKADEEAMNRILAKYDQRLYKIEKRTGPVFAMSKTSGELAAKTPRDVFIDQSIASEVAQAKQTGFRDFCWVVDVGFRDRHMPLEQEFKSTEKQYQLLKELKPILAKYQRK